MKHYLLLLLLFILHQQAAAQINYTEKIRKELAAHPAEDTFRVNLLNDLCLQNDITRPEKIKLSTEALDISQKINYPVGEGIALGYLGITQRLHGNAGEGIKMMNRADSIADKTGDPKLRALILLRKSAADYSAKALDFYLPAEKLAAQINDNHLLSLLQQDAGETYMINLGNYPMAMEYYLKSLQSAQEIEDLGMMVTIWNDLGALYANLGDQEKALYYFQQSSGGNKHLQSKEMESRLQSNIGESYRLTGKYNQAIAAYQLSNQLVTTNLRNIAINESNLADVYTRIDSLPRAFVYCFHSLAFFQQSNDSTILGWIYGILSRASLKSNRADSAIYYGQLGLFCAQQASALEFLRDNTLALANAYAAKKNFGEAYNYHLQYITYRDSMLNGEVRNKTALLEYNSNLDQKQAQIKSLDQKQKYQSRILYSIAAVLVLILLSSLLLLRNNRQKRKANRLINEKAIELTKQKEELQQSYNNVEQLSEIGRKVTSSLDVKQIIGTVYENVNQLMDAAVFGIGLHNELLHALEYPATFENGEALPFYTNSLQDKTRFGAICFNAAKEITIGDLGAEYKDHLQEIATPNQGAQPESIIFLPLMAKEKKLGVITVQSFKKHAYTAYHLYMLRNIANYSAIAIENAESYETLHQTLGQLKDTQKQLVQSEKMASLGELTAGIAHEIQNPLNFVNNFSEINKELIEEIQSTRSKMNGERYEQLQDELLLNIKDNEEKIIHHGRRADAIVKGMLQHSRKDTGAKEPTDINNLTDEYLRLCYHGIRAKDKEFNVTIKTDYDNSIGKINIIPQDIGRVLLNLYNNAFYAVNEKKKLNIEGYKPTVSVATKKLNNSVTISVRDNGNGIPQSVVDKIFQPFFTTKPTGEGTGLGLSLSYDIIKAHGGEIKVETKEGEGSTFIIQLPV